MKRTLVLICGLLSFGGIANSNHALSGKEIFVANRDAIVEIGSGTQFFGNGFIISADGFVLTANHVVTTKESKFRTYVSDIKVRVLRNGVVTLYAATPSESNISDDQVNFDSVILKISASNLPHVSLGDWDEVEIGSEITIIPSWPGYETMMLQGLVSNRASVINAVLGPKPMETIFFQCPVRNGFSGAPIFSEKGHVIGIVDTKVFGISPALDALRNGWEATRSTGFSMSFGGVDIGSSFLEMINNLDQNLISGLGSGVAIDYAKKQKGNTQEPATQH